jgi:hypothetical protein
MALRDRPIGTEGLPPPPGEAVGVWTYTSMARRAEGVHGLCYPCTAAPIPASRYFPQTASLGEEVTTYRTARDPILAPPPARTGAALAILAALGSSSNNSANLSTMAPPNCSASTIVTARE